jgi:hypothetical protein
MESATAVDWLSKATAFYKSTTNTVYWYATVLLKNTTKYETIEYSYTIPDSMAPAGSILSKVVSPNAP